MEKNHFMAAILKIRYYGHHENICERLHIQKCLFGDSLHVCQIWWKSAQFFFCLAASLWEISDHMQCIRIFGAIYLFIMICSYMSACMHIVKISSSKLGKLSPGREFQSLMVAGKNECWNKSSLVGNCLNFNWWPLVTVPIGCKWVLKYTSTTLWVLWVPLKLLQYVRNTRVAILSNPQKKIWQLLSIASTKIHGQNVLC